MGHQAELGTSGPNSDHLGKHDSRNQHVACRGKGGSMLGTAGQAALASLPPVHGRGQWPEDSRLLS